jgi:hypothetical protein
MSKHAVPSTTRDYWLRTNDPNCVVFVPNFEDEDILVLDVRENDVPAESEFRLANTLSEATMNEARQVAADYNLELLEDHVAVTFRNE